MLNINFNDIKINFDPENPQGVTAAIYTEGSAGYSFLRNAKVKILDELMTRGEVEVYVNRDWMVDHIDIRRYTDALKWHVVTLGYGTEN